MWFLTELAERRIREAQDNGDFDHLPGAGQPLPPDEIDPLVPEHQRIAYRVLKNSGFLPPELEAHKEAVDLALQLATQNAAVPVEDYERLLRLNQLLRQSGHAALTVPEAYLAQVAQRLRGALSQE